MIYVSVDGGYNFEAFQDTPIMTHPVGQDDFRDPYIFRKDGNFIVYHAENNKFGVYTSNTLNGAYTFRGSYNAPHPLLECPNLFELNVNGDTNNKKWVLIYGGAEDLLGTGTYASVGHLDANYVFVAEQESIRVDFGTDFYAAKPFSDTTASDVNDHLLCLGWAGNWGYVGSVPRETRGGVGATSTRMLKLAYENGSYDLKSDVIGVFDYLDNPTVGYNANTNINLPFVKGDSFYLKLKFPNADTYKGTINVIFTGNEYDTTFSFNLDTNICKVHRYSSSFTNNGEFSKDREFTFRRTVVGDLWLEFFVDRVLIEMIAPTRNMFTTAKFPNGRSRETITVNSSGNMNFTYEYYQIKKQHLE